MSFVFFTHLTFIIFVERGEKKHAHWKFRDDFNTAVKIRVRENVFLSLETLREYLSFNIYKDAWTIRLKKMYRVSRFNQRKQNSTPF